MRGVGDRGEVAHGAARARVLDEDAEDVAPTPSSLLENGRRRSPVDEVDLDDADPQRLRAGADDGPRLRQHVGVDDEHRPRPAPSTSAA